MFLTIHFEGIPFLYSNVSEVHQSGGILEKPGVILVCIARQFLLDEACGGNASE